MAGWLAAKDNGVRFRFKIVLSRMGLVLQKDTPQLYVLYSMFA